MRTILLATVAGVLLTGNAVARDKCPTSNSDCQTARFDVLEARKGALEDELTALRAQIARERQQAREQISEQIKDIKNKINTLKVQNGIPVELPETSLQKQINIPVGSSRVWHAPKPFKTVIPGDIETADVIPGETNADVIISAKKEGFTNFVLVDGEGIAVADIKVSVGNPVSLHQVRVHNKKDNLSSYTSYQCLSDQNHHCLRREDKMEGTDRAPPPNTVVNLGGLVTPSGTPK